MDYKDVRDANFMTGVMVTVAGVPLDTEGAPVGQAFANHRPVLWCTCATEPCECEGPILWIGGADVRQEVPTDRQHKAGGQLHEFKLNADTAVLVESIVGTKAGALPAISQGRRSVDYRFATKAAYPGRDISGVNCTEIFGPCRWPFGFLTCRETICTDPDAGLMLAAYY